MCIVTGIIIQSKFFYLSIGREPITRPAHAQLRPTVFRGKIFFLPMHKRNHAFLLLAIAPACIKMADRFASRGYS